MKRGLTASVAVAILLLAPAELPAKSRSVGFRVPSFHSVRPALSNRLRAHLGTFRHFPLFGDSIESAPYFAPDYVSDVLLERFVSPAEPPRVLNCRRTQETVTVPAEDGGTRELRITRC